MLNVAPGTTGLRAEYIAEGTALSIARRPSLSSRFQAEEWDLGLIDGRPGICHLRPAESAVHR
jgi:hypothetical protein